MRMNSPGTSARRLLASAVALGMCSLTGLAQAQQPVLEEVVVTAQKRAQDIQEVPIAVTAFGGDQIATGNIAQLTDIALRTPGVTMSQFNIGEPQI